MCGTEQSSYYSDTASSSQLSSRRRDSVCHRGASVRFFVWFVYFFFLPSLPAYQYISFTFVGCERHVLHCYDEPAPARDTDDS